MADLGRFAPSTTGRAHPGTLLAALLCWLDARCRGGAVWLRLEDLDPERCTAAFAAGLQEDLAWLGLDWDGVWAQHERLAGYEAALDRLAAQGRLYPSPTSRAELQRLGRRGPDGGWAYDNRDRQRPLPSGGWRQCADPLRVRLDDGVMMVRDEDGGDLSQDPAAELGDPVVRRRDGAFSYQLVCAVDDGAMGVTRVVRGRDIASSTATQVALQRLLGLATPVYRHHFLLLEDRERKLAKLHGAVAAPELRAAYDGPRLCGLLSQWSGLRPDASPCVPGDLVAGFAWERVRREDLVVRWNGTGLSSDR
jgi:glutamyl/glutaminyl-tRNA synthetase